MLARMEQSLGNPAEIQWFFGYIPAQGNHSYYRIPP